MNINPDPEIEAIKKTKFIANKDTAPCCYQIRENIELRLLIDIYKRISYQIDIYEGYNDYTCAKIKKLILPHLLEDKLIAKDKNGFSAQYDDLLFEGVSKKERVRKIAGALQGSLDVMSKENLDTTKMFYLNYKKIPKTSYDEIIHDAKSLLKKILALHEVENKGNVDCEFSYFSFFNQRKD
ncbi:hypothetical protein [Fluviispira multicolorata]|uniref:Uncharacterized protein n=1 Tax=Fluviispira multicolorata TaxID=2654512 RepID=A0A833JE43_9BACT|nr:hypothetical protein [Fluviispira multicolorata]KAB8031862.1 hypothetical protein GCL57_04250 [Fluviispira multicolorata]